MASVIYYFSGTGNSLRAARAIAAQIGECRIINVATAAAGKDPVAGSDTIGFVYPVHFGDMPDTMKRFIGSITFDGLPYVFAIATSGAGMPGKALASADRLLRKNGAGLSAGFVLDMPDNAYPGMNMITPPEQRAAILETSECRLAEIAGIIKKKEKAGISGKNASTGRVVMPLMKAVIIHGFRVQDRFSISGRCKGCGTCAKICPAGNLSVDGKKVVRGDHCALCLACFHWCPQQAVQIGRKSEGIARYHHPVVGIEDMACRQS